MDMKKNFTLYACLITVAMTLTACGGGSNSANSGDMGMDNPQWASALAALPVESLNEAERTSLVFMREEEKLASDVYTSLNNLYADRTKTFGNIISSEASHQEGVRLLLQRYGLTDPASGQSVGVFANPELQALYNQLRTQGKTDLLEAFKAGLTIEEMDIRDLQDALQHVDNQDMIMVYNNLLKGSRNHLRSFNKGLLQQGG